MCECVSVNIQTCRRTALITKHTIRLLKEIFFPITIFIFAFLSSVCSRKSWSLLEVHVNVICWYLVVVFHLTFAFGIHHTLLTVHCCLFIAEHFSVAWVCLRIGIGAEQRLVFREPRGSQRGYPGCDLTIWYQSWQHGFQEWVKPFRCFQKKPADIICQNRKHISLYSPSLSPKNPEASLNTEGPYAVRSMEVLPLPALNIVIALWKGSWSRRELVYLK